MSNNAHLRANLSVAMVAAAGVTILSCTNTLPPEVPLFNAVDRSIQCEEGKVGWDFSTGGGVDEEIRDARISSEIRVLSATWGLNCGVDVGVHTDALAKAVNGALDYKGKLRDFALADPAPGCAKDFRATYVCGQDPEEYEVTLDAEAQDKPFRFVCGERITIREASYGENVDSKFVGNLTPKLVDYCSGKRRCQWKADDAFFGSDPSPGNTKSTLVKFYCGNSAVVQSLTFEQHRPAEIVCDTSYESAREVIAPIVDQVVVNTTVRKGFLSRTEYYQADATVAARAQCQNRASCQLAVNDYVPNYPIYSPLYRSDELIVAYRCNASQSPIVDQGKSVSIACGPNIEILTATVGEACGAPKDNILQYTKDSCDGVGACVFGKNIFEILGAAAPTCANSSTRIQYRCEGDATVRTGDFSVFEKPRFVCPPAIVSSVANQGIRVQSILAINGCNNDSISFKGVGTIQADCFSKQSCAFAIPNIFAFACDKNSVDVSYTCGEEKRARVVRKPLSSIGTNVQLSCEPRIEVVSASYSNCAGAVSDETKSLTDACEGRAGVCATTFQPSPASNCATDSLNVVYSCGYSPNTRVAQVQKSGGAFAVSFDCPQESVSSEKACIPQHCCGFARRDSRLECVADKTKPRVPRIVALEVGVQAAAFAEQGKFDGIFKEGIPYNFTLQYSLEEPRKNVRAGDYVSKTTLWVTDTYVNRATQERVTGFRCIIAVGSTFTGSNPSQLVANFDRVDISPVCFGARNPSARDAAQRAGVSLEELTRNYELTGDTKLHVSFDADGKANVLREDGETFNTAKVPNPIGFFYDKKKVWTDSYSYFNQSLVSPQVQRRSFSRAADASVQFSLSNDITLGLSKVVARNPYIEVAAGATDVPWEISYLPLGPRPYLEVDATWHMMGDSYGRNPFSPKGKPLSPDIKTLTQRNLRATLEIAPADAARNETDWVLGFASPALTLGKADGVRLPEGNMSGVTSRIRGTLNKAVLERLFKQSDGSNVGWDGQNVFRVRVCLDVDGSERGILGNGPPLVATRKGGVEYKVNFAKRCLLAPQRIVVRREYETVPFAKEQDPDATDSSENSDNGDDRVNTRHDMGVESKCDGPGASLDGCRQVDRNKGGSGGGLSPNRSLFTSTTTNETSTKNGTTTTSNAVDTKLLNYTILESGKPNSESRVETFKPTTFKLKTIPPWQVIEATQALQSGAQATLPVKTKFKRAKVRPGKDGLAIGEAVEGFIAVGSFLVAVEFAVVAGFTIEVGLEVETSYDDDAYPCVGSNGTCYQADATEVSLSDANTACQIRGGQLAELRTPSAVAGVKQVNTPGGGPFWIGAQLGYSYNRFDCMDRPQDGDCIASSKTGFRWISSGHKFAQIGGPSGSAIPIEGGAPAELSLASLTTRVPTPSGVAFSKVGGLVTLPISSKEEFICEYEAAQAAKRLRTAVYGEIGFGTGVTAEACYPNKFYGLCVTGAFSLVNAGLKLTYERSNVDLFNNTNRAASARFGTRGNKKLALTWDVKFLSGIAEAELRMVIASLSWTLAEYKGVEIPGNVPTKGTIFEYNWPSRRRFFNP